VPKYSNGGAESADGVGSRREEVPPLSGGGSGRELYPLPRIFFCIFSFKMVHFDAFWTLEHILTKCNCHYDVHDINSNILKLHMLNSAAKR